MLEPFSLGAVQSTTTLVPLFDVVGVDGVEGAIACRIDKLDDGSL